MQVDLLLIAAAFRYGNYIIMDHADEERLNDDVTIQFLEEAIGKDKPKIIEKTSRKCLILGWGTATEPLHVSVAFSDDDATRYRVVTVYRPDRKKYLWVNNYEKRRNE